jgi:TolB-like protein/Tfp pilus assembly protein PilF
MLCGIRPFRGDTHMRVMDQIVHAPTPPLEGRAAHAPESVARVVRRALEKDVAHRYQSAREMAAELAAWNAQPIVSTEFAPVAETPSGSQAPIVPDAVAVMTFANVTRRPEDDWLGTGIAETVTADLKHVKGLTVIDRESACCADVAIAGVGADASAETLARTAGQLLGVAWIVGGGFQRSGDHLRITARFADARTGAVLRTIKIDGEMSSIFELQDRIVEELCDGLDLALARSEIEAIERKETQSVDAYRAYSRGLAELRDGEPEAFERATVHLAEAVRLDPNYSVAWAALGSAYCLKGFFLAQREIIREALDFERKALAIDPTNALAHEWLSSAQLYLGDVEEAVRSSREAMRLDPRSASARAAHGRAYWLGRGMIVEGIRELEAATGLDPNLGYAYLQLGYLYAITGDFERAEAASRRAVDLEDASASGTLGLKMVGARTRLGYVYYRTGRFGEALAAYTIERAAIEAGSHTVRDRALIELDQKIGAAHLALGHADEAAAALGRAIAESRARAEWRPLDPATSYYFACALALTGEIQPALEALARAAAHNPAVTKRRALADPDLASLADEPEFRRLTAPDDDALATNVG